MKPIFVLKRNGRTLTARESAIDPVLWYKKMSIVSELMTIGGSETHAGDEPVGIVLNVVDARSGETIEYNIFDAGSSRCATTAAEQLRKRFGPANPDLRP